MIPQPNSLYSYTSTYSLCLFPFQIRSGTWRVCRTTFCTLSSSFRCRPDQTNPSVLLSHYSAEFKRRPIWGGRLFRQKFWAFGHIHIFSCWITWRSALVEIFSGSTQKWPFFQNFGPKFDKISKIFFLLRWAVCWGYNPEKISFPWSTLKISSKSMQ